MRPMLAFALAACGGATQVTPVPQPPPARPSRSAVDAQYATLVANPRAMRATITTFELSIANEHATLVEREETADVATLEAADRTTAWTPRATRTYRGRARVEGDATVLDLDTEGAQPLHLRCVGADVDVLTAGGLRTGDSTSVHVPVARMHVLACGEAMQPAAADPDDDERLLFAHGLLEHATEVGGCETLRRIDSR